MSDDKQEKRAKPKPVVAQAKAAEARVHQLAYHMAAWDFYRAGAYLLGNSKGFPRVACHLLCQSIELLLKAFLFISGTSVGALAKKPYCHNLTRLLTDATAQGLPSVAPLSPDHQAAIRKSNAYYNDDGQLPLRYFNAYEAFTGYKKGPNPETLADAAKVLLDSLETPCKKAVNKR